MKIPTNRWRDLFYICIAEFQCNHSAPVQGKRKNTPVQTKSHYSLAQIKTPNPCTHTHVNVHLPCFVYKSSDTMEWKNSQYIYSTWEKKKKDRWSRTRQRKKKDIYLLFNAIPKALNRIFEQDFWTILRIQMLKRGCSMRWMRDL